MEEAKQIGSEEVHSDSHKIDPVDPGKICLTNLGELDRSTQEIRKWSELEAANSPASVKVNDGGGGGVANDEPSNEIPSHGRKANGREKNDLVDCPNQEKGCKWKGRPEDLQEHLNKFPGSKIPGEVEGCGFQTIECECKESVVFNHKPAHLREHQNHQVVACEFNYAGCQFSCQRYLMPKHQEVNMLDHVQKLNVFTKRNASDVRFHAYSWVILSIAIILTLALVDYKLERFREDWKREEVTLFMAWATQSSQIRNLKTRDREQILEWTTQQSKQKQLVDDLYRIDSWQNELEAQLSEQIRLVNDLRIRVDLLQHDVQKDLTEEMFQVQNKTKNLKTKLNSYMSDVDEKIQQLQDFQHQAKNTLLDLEFNVTELMTGFSKKYIDDTVRAIMCRLPIPKRISGC